MKKHDLLIIEITEHRLRVLKAKPLDGKNFQVLSFSALKIENTARDNIIRLLTSLISPRDKKSSVVVVVPRNQVILKNFSFPSYSKDEIRKMITLQMATQLPYAKEDIVFDYVLLGADKAGFMSVLSAVIHKDVGEEFVKILKGAGLTAERFVLSSSSIARWFYQRLPEDAKEDKATSAVLNFEPTTSELCFVKGGELLYSREIKYGHRDLGGDFEGAFLKDIGLTIEAYLKEHPAERVGKLYALTTPQNKYPLFEGIRAEKNIDIRFIDPAASLQGIPVDPRDRSGASAVVCLGAIAESQKASFNLLPEETRQKQAEKVRRRQLVKLMILVTFNIGLLFLLFAQEFYQKRLTLKDLEDRTSDMRVRAEAVEKKKEKIRQVEKIVAPSFSTVDILYSLYDMTPKEVSFQSVALDRNDILTIQGIAETRASVNDFFRNLAGSPFFKDVNLQYAAQRKFFEGEITDFKIMAGVQRLKERF